MDRIDVMWSPLTNRKIIIIEYYSLYCVLALLAMSVQRCSE